MDEIKAELKAKWEALTLPMKLLAVLGAPLILGYIILRIVSTISGFLNDRSRSKTDVEATKLNEQAQQINQDIAHEQGALATTQDQEKEALDAAKKDDPNNFFNSRFNDPSKK